LEQGALTSGGVTRETGKMLYIITQARAYFHSTFFALADDCTVVADVNNLSIGVLFALFLPFADFYLIVKHFCL